MENKESIKHQIEKQILNLLQLAWKGRLIKIGYDDIVEELKKGKKGFLIIAKDVSKRTKRNILFKYEGEYFEIFTKEILGSSLGKKEVGIIFIPETKLGLKIKELLNKYEQLK